MDFNYSPPKNLIGRILTGSRFQLILAEVTAEYPNESLNSRGRWAFILFQGYAGSFLGYKYGLKYEERFTLPGLNIHEKNSIDYAATQLTGQPGNHAPQADGADLFFDIIPDAIGAAKDGALEGVNNIKNTLKWAVPLILVIYAAPPLIRAYKAAKS